MILRLMLLTLLAPCAVVAAEISREPLPVMQHNPAMMRYFDPHPTSATVLQTGQQQLRLQTHYSSIFLADQLPNARCYLADMELFVVETGVRYGIGHHIDITVNIPIMRALSGGMDTFLHQYHRALGLPNSGRELRPNNQFGYFYHNGGAGWSGQPRWEIGNTQLTLRSQLIRQQWALLAGLQLPTASQSRGWSRGNNSSGIDLALGTVASWQRGLWFGHHEGWWVHPFSRSDSGSHIRDYLRASATVGRRIALFSTPIHALLQAQGGSSPYRTGVAALDSAPWLISIGLRTASHDGWQWNIAFVENITQSSTQDFSLSLGVTVPFSY